MDFSKLSSLRRSIRNFQDKEVPLEIIHEILKQSTFAPSARNGQPWKFIVVNNRDMIKKISDESKKNILNRIYENPGDYAARYKTMLEDKEYNVFYNAPCLVMVLGEKSVKNLYVDCTLAASYFMMSAASKGLGTCWVNLGKEIYDKDMISQLGIPENCEIVAPLILGYPQKITSPVPRKEPEILKIIS